MDSRTTTTASDTFHDAPLKRLGQKLAASAEGLGRTYRLGGNEFCFLAPRGQESPDGLAAMGAEALTEEGEGFVIGPRMEPLCFPTKAAGHPSCSRPLT